MWVFGGLTRRCCSRSRQSQRFFSPKQVLPSYGIVQERTAGCGTQHYGPSVSAPAVSAKNHAFPAGDVQQVFLSFFTSNIGKCTAFIMKTEDGAGHTFDSDAFVASRTRDMRVGAPPSGCTRQCCFSHRVCVCVCVCMCRVARRAWFERKPSIISCHGWWRTLMTPVLKYVLGDCSHCSRLLTHASAWPSWSTTPP